MRVVDKIPKSITFLLGMTILTGALYPAAVTLVAQLAFPSKANGSLLLVGGAVRGSILLAQKFESPAYFRARPSASDYAYIGAGASNLGPVSADLAKAVADRRAAWAKDFGAGGSPQAAAPEDLLYASASGLDPDISLEAALAQAPRVAAARAGAGPNGAGLGAALTEEIRRRAAGATSLIGPPRVNVVSLNAWLDREASIGGRYGE
jgi:potassium-transporting ATPase KdpC subunit